MMWAATASGPISIVIPDSVRVFPLQPHITDRSDQWSLLNGSKIGDGHQYVVDTTIVMALAAILVANSHLERFYAYHWPAGDG
jgi:hypothetical protein